MDLPTSPDSALLQLQSQRRFCECEGEKFKKRNALDSALFYFNKEQELKWQIVQLEKYYEETGKLMELRQDTLSVPVLADNNELGETELELDIHDIYYNSRSESKKSYYLRYVICLPLQKQVLQEQKSCSFKTCNVSAAENKLYFNYPRADSKMCESLKRGYLTVELYGERKLKAPSLVGAKRIPLVALLNESCLKGMMTFGPPDFEWDVSYAVSIRRAQSLDEKDNFKMVLKEWIAVKCEQVSTGRRNSLLAGRSPHQPDTHKRRRRSHHSHHGHHSHTHRSSTSKHHREDRRSKDATPVAIAEDANTNKSDVTLPDLKGFETKNQNSDRDSNHEIIESESHDSAGDKTESESTDKDNNGVINVIHKLNVTAYEF